MENRSLLEANADFHLIGERMLLALWDPPLLLFDHGLEVHVDLNTCKLVIGFSLGSKLTRLLHFQPSFITFEFNLVNFVSCGDLAVQRLVAKELLSGSQIHH